MNGKGSKRRLQNISTQEMNANWDRIFGKDKVVPKPKRVITAATYQLEIAQCMAKDSGNPIDLKDLTCKYFDSGWCYHPDSGDVHACPGLGKCDVIIEIIE